MSVLFWLVAATGLLPQQLASFDSSGFAVPPDRVRLATIPHYQPVLRFSAPAARFVPQQRPIAVQLSDGYYTRLKIHRYASYAMVPLFIAEYAIGQKLYSQPGENESLRGTHGAVAGGIYALFAVNTVTGAWNLWETRAQPEGRTRRYVHSALMFLAGAGFVATGMLAPDDEEEGGTGTDSGSRSTHRSVAIASFSTTIVGGLMMVIWNK